MRYQRVQLPIEEVRLPAMAGFLRRHAAAWFADCRSR